MKTPRRKIKMRVDKKRRLLIIFSILVPFLISCEDLFTRFKYETYECENNPVKLKKIFIKNYEIGDIVEVEFENGGYELEIIESNDFFIELKRFDPKIQIKIDRKSHYININAKNHISNFECTNYVFKM